MDRRTIEVYERSAAAYAAGRSLNDPDRVEAFARAVPTGARRLDLGCGPGIYLRALGQPAIALDAALAMVRAAREVVPGTPGVQADLCHLPFGTATFGGIWASKAHQHLRAADLPLALAEVHRCLTVGGRFELTVFAGEGSPEISGENRPDDLPGRLFTWWDPEHLATVVEAAGFSVDRLELAPTDDASHPRLMVTATRLRALPDFVGADLRLLCCGLNPSLHAADAGVGYVTGSNRFWRAMVAAGLATRDRDPRHLLEVDRIGMTDLVKRPTARADEVSADEFRQGIARLEALCRWLRPAAVAVVGLVGWRTAVDRKAAVGWQPTPLGPTPVYVLPSTSGLNAGTSLDELAGHLLAAAAGPPG